MKFAYAYVLIALLGTAFARPEPYSKRVSLDLSDINERGNVTIRDDESDWVIVAYSDSANGGQCGGTDTSTAGKIGGACLDMATKCIDFAVSLSSAAAGMQCQVNLDSTKCGGTSGGTVGPVKSGDNKKGYNVGDTVHFFDVSCEEATS